MSPVALFSWVLANHVQLIGLLVGIVAAASALVRAVELLLSFLLAVFPGLQRADGTLLHVASALDRLSKWPFLNSLALNPKRGALARRVPPPPSPVRIAEPELAQSLAQGGSVVKALALALVVGVGLVGAPAHAQVQVSSGPTVPLIELRPGVHPVSLAPGAGYQVSFTWPQFQRAINGRSWDLLDLQVLGFGTAISATSGETFGALSAAVGICTLSSLLCVGGGHDIVTAGGFKSSFFAVMAFSINFGTAPSSPPVGIERGAMGLPRGNTLYFGAP